MTQLVTKKEKQLKTYYVILDGGDLITILAHYFSIDNGKSRASFYIEGREGPIRTFSGDEWVEIFD